MTILEILDEFGVPYRQTGEHHHVTTGWVGMDCPHCSPESGKFRLGYNLAWNRMSCWVCGSQQLIPALCAITNQPYPKIKDLVGGMDRSLVAKEEPIRGNLVLPVGVGTLLPIHRKYLKERRFDPDELEKMWKIQGIGFAPKLAWRIFIPIIFRGSVVSWTTRSVSDNHHARYRGASPSQERMRAKSLLYGEYHSRHSIIVCEGPTDVWRIGPGAVATLGVGTTRSQLIRMVRYPKRFVCFDSDKDAQRRAKDLCLQLLPMGGETHNIVLDAKDAGSAKPKEIKQLRRLLR